jgi:hypothetical protein
MSEPQMMFSERPKVVGAKARHANRAVHIVSDSWLRLRRIAAFRWRTFGN